LKQTLADKCLASIHSPNLAPCDIFLFPEAKNALKGTNFQSVGEVKSKTMDLLITV
jgi:hypothetical protein